MKELAPRITENGMDYVMAYRKRNGLCYGLKIRKIMVQCNP